MNEPTKVKIRWGPGGVKEVDSSLLPKAVEGLEMHFGYKAFEEVTKFHFNDITNRILVVVGNEVIGGGIGFSVRSYRLMKGNQNLLYAVDSTGRISSYHENPRKVLKSIDWYLKK